MEPNKQIENNGKELVRDENGRVVGGVLNPNGRPKKGHSITETIRAMMDEKPEIKKALGAKILQMAVEGDITAIKTIWNYIDGMPLQKSEIGGPDGQPILISANRGFIPPGTPIVASPDGSHAIEPPKVQDDSLAPKG
jgi:hypothetical protein